MATTTPANYYQVSQEQIDACHRVINNTARKVFYQVQSATDATVEYHVEFNTTHRVLQCNCKAGSEGRNCWHKRAALAAEAEFQALKRAERQAAARIEETRQYRLEQAEQALYTAQLNQDQERNATVQTASGEWW